MNSELKAARALRGERLFSTSRRARRSPHRNIAILLVVALGHSGVASLLLLDPVQIQRIRPEPGVLVAEILRSDVELAGAEPTFSPLAPSVELTAPHLAFDMSEESRREDPRIDPDAALSTAPFVSRAQLQPGEVVTVMLLLQIAADGAVLSAEVVRSNGTETATAAAIEFARETKWIPGTLDGQPRTMQASLTVILGES